MGHNISALFIHHIFGHASHNCILQVAKIRIYTDLSKSIPKFLHPCHACNISKVPAYSVTQMLTQNTLIRELASILTSYSSTRSPVKKYPIPHNYWCHYQPPIWISHKIKASDTPTHEDLHLVLPTPCLQELHLTFWWRWWDLLISRSHVNLYCPWVNFWNHWCICLRNQQESGTYPPNHKEHGLNPKNLLCTPRWHLMFMLSIHCLDHFSHNQQAPWYIPHCCLV